MTEERLADAVCDRLSTQNLEADIARASAQAKAAGDAGDDACWRAYCQVVQALKAKRPPETVARLESERLARARAA